MITIIFGKIASGKTFYTNQIKNSCIYHIDDLLLELTNSCLGRNQHHALEIILEKYFINQAIQNEKECINTVIDYGFWTHEERKLAHEMLKPFIYEMIYLDTLKEKRIENLIKRNEKIENCYRFTIEKFNYLDNFFEELNEVEKCYIKTIKI